MLNIGEMQKKSGSSGRSFVVHALVVLGIFAISEIEHDTVAEELINEILVRKLQFAIVREANVLNKLLFEPVNAKDSFAGVIDGE